MTFGSLFAGIGGMDLGLERAGMRCAWQVEIDDYARRVLSRHWPDVRRHDDVRTFPPGDPGDWRVDLIAGGFPCQDISDAGKREGIEGKQSGLWSEFARVIRLLRPRFVLVENVEPLRRRGLGRVLGDLAALGFDAEWEVLPAAAFGAPHLRERLFLVAHDPLHGRRAGRPGRPARGPQGLRQPARGAATLADADGEPRDGLHERARPIDMAPDTGICGAPVADRASAEDRRGRPVFHRPPAPSDWWDAEPGMGRVVHGISARMVEPRIRGLGNAVVPQVAEWIGRRILEAAS